MNNTLQPSLQLGPEQRYRSPRLGARQTTMISRLLLLRWQTCSRMLQQSERLPKNIHCPSLSRPGLSHQIPTSRPGLSRPGLSRPGLSRPCLSLPGLPPFSSRPFPSWPFHLYCLIIPAPGSLPGCSRLPCCFLIIQFFLLPGRSRVAPGSSVVFALSNFSRSRVAPGLLPGLLLFSYYLIFPAPGSLPGCSRVPCCFLII